MRRLASAARGTAGLACRVAWADDFTLPGLEADSAAYERTLTSRFPAGGTPQARKQAEQAAAAATRKQDWAAAAAAWETRVAQGDAATAQWLALADAQMRRTPPAASRALQAAWQNFSSAETGAAEVPALLLMAEALQVLNRPAQAIQALEAAAERAPDNKTIVQKLDEARRATGILVRRVATEPEAEPPRACIDFTVAPARRDDFHAEDWVRLDPPVQGAAVTREGDQICVSGLPSGATTRIMLRAGMPGEVRTEPGEGHHAEHRNGQSAPAHRLRHAHVRAAARPDPGDRADHGQPLRGQADPGAAYRAQRRRLRAECQARPAGRILGRRPDRRTDRPRGLAGQRRHPELAAEPHRAHRAADA